MTNLPAWADAELSAALPTLVLAGETQTTEFKREFPQQVSDLAKEIAGFATSNAGTILIGVDDDCAIVGLASADHRASIVQRVEGLCANSIKPRITPRVRYADVDDKCVVAIDVPKGAQPVYWVGNVPYMRQVTAARPMSPDEVIEAVLNWARDKRSAEELFRNRLADLLVEADIAVAELRVREFNPWFENLKDQLGDIADQARELAASAPHETAATMAQLEQFAEECDTIACDTPRMNGPGVDFLTALDDADAIITRLRSGWAGPGRFGKRDTDQAIERVHVTSRLLTGFVARIEADADDQEWDVLREPARDRGIEILRAASRGVGVGDDAERRALWEIGMAIREVETRDVLADEHFSEALGDLRSLSQRLEGWLSARRPG